MSLNSESPMTLIWRLGIMTGVGALTTSENVGLVCSGGFGGYSTIDVSRWSFLPKLCEAFKNASLLRTEPVPEPLFLVDNDLPRSSVSVVVSLSCVINKLRTDPELKRLDHVPFAGVEDL